MTVAAAYPEQRKVGTLAKLAARPRTSGLRPPP